MAGQAKEAPGTSITDASKLVRASIIRPNFGVNTRHSSQFPQKSTPPYPLVVRLPLSMFYHDMEPATQQLASPRCMLAS